MHHDPAAAHATEAALPARGHRARGQGAWMHLLTALLRLAGGKAELLRHHERAWASATFAGTRHGVVLAFTGAEAVAAGEALVDALPEHEFAIPRQLVADAAVIALDHAQLPQPRLEVEIAVLLLDDC